MIVHDSLRSMFFPTDFDGKEDQLQCQKEQLIQKWIVYIAGLTLQWLREQLSLSKYQHKMLLSPSPTDLCTHTKSWLFSFPECVAQ